MKLYIIRGLPGSGKTTKAVEIHKKITEDGYECYHAEADLYFTSNNEYNFDAKELYNAHNWCRLNVRKAMRDKKYVIVSNTFTRPWEYKDYIDLAEEFSYNFEIITMTGTYKNIHNVPEEKILQMKERWID